MAMIPDVRAVRDGIPEKIREQGGDCEAWSVPDGSYLRHLEYALLHELEAYLESQDPEELADLVEVIHAIARIRGLSPADLERIRAGRRQAYGGYDENVLLGSVTEPEPEERLLCTCGSDDHLGGAR